MPGFSRRPLAVLLCCLFAGTQTGHAIADAAPAVVADVPLLLAANEPPLNLRKERRFNLLKKKKAPAEKPGAPMQLPDQAPPAAVQPDDSYPLFMMWCGAGLTVQVLTYAVLARAFPRLPDQLAGNNVAAGATAGIVSLVVGIINAACMS